MVAVLLHMSTLWLCYIKRSIELLLRIVKFLISKTIATGCIRRISPALSRYAHYVARRRRTRKALPSLVLLLSLLHVLSLLYITERCSQVVSMKAHEEICSTRDGIKACAFNEAILITLQPLQQETFGAVKDDDNLSAKLQRGCMRNYLTSRQIKVFPFTVNNGPLYTFCSQSCRGPWYDSRRVNLYRGVHYFHMFYLGYRCQHGCNGSRKRLPYLKQNSASCRTDRHMDQSQIQSHRDNCSATTNIISKVRSNGLFRLNSRTCLSRTAHASQRWTITMVHTRPQNCLFARSLVTHANALMVNTRRHSPELPVPLQISQSSPLTQTFKSFINFSTKMFTKPMLDPLCNYTLWP
ncbi:hypothetical protein COOONC_21762 [Cooperia oncophora]